METFGADSFLTLTVRVSRGADDVVLLPERFTDLTAGDGTAASIVFVSATADVAGGITCQWRPAIPWNGDQREYLHMRVQLR